MVTRVQSIQKGVNDDAKAANMMKQVAYNYVENYFNAVCRKSSIIGRISSVRKNARKKFCRQ